MAVPVEKVLAAASGSTGGLGKIGTLAATSGVMYVRADTGNANVRRALWRVQSNNGHSVAFYRARTRVDSVTLTLSSLADTETAIVNGLTYTGEATAADAAYASRKFNVGGDDTADAAALTALINADYAVATAGTSVAATDKLTFVTDEGTKSITAAAAADYPGSKYALNATAATEMASIVLAINHKRNVTLASCTAGNTVTIERGSGGPTYTYTAHATTTTTASRQFSISGNDAADATELAACINADTATHGYEATASSNVVYVGRNAQAVPEPNLTSSSATLAACVNTTGGIPGVIAEATGATAELSITPTWTKTLTVTESGDQLTVTDIDTPGILATSALGVVTIVPGTPAGAGGDYASVIYAITGTAGAHCAVANGTLANLILDEGSSRTGLAANSTTAGTLYEVYADGFPHLYAGITNTEGDAGTYVVGCTLI